VVVSLTRVYTKGLKVDLEGEKALVVLLMSLERDEWSSVLSKACREAMEPILASAKARVRVGDWSKRGRLERREWVNGKWNRSSTAVRGVRTRSGIRTVHLRDSLKLAERRWVRMPRGEARISYSKFTGAHGVFIELGTKPHKIVTTWPFGKRHTIQHPGHRAWPFLRPSYIHHRIEAERTVRRVVWNRIVERVNVAKGGSKGSSDWSKAA